MLCLAELGRAIVEKEERWEVSPDEAANAVGVDGKVWKGSDWTVVREESTVSRNGFEGADCSVFPVAGLLASCICWAVSSMANRCCGDVPIGLESHIEHRKYRS